MNQQKINIYKKLRAMSHGIIEPYIVHPDNYTVTYTDPDRVYFLGQNIESALITLTRTLQDIRKRIRQRPSVYLIEGFNNHIIPGIKNHIDILKYILLYDLASDNAEGILSETLSGISPSPMEDSPSPFFTDNSDSIHERPIQNFHEDDKWEDETEEFETEEFDNELFDIIVDENGNPIMNPNFLQILTHYRRIYNDVVAEKLANAHYELHIHSKK